MLGYYQFHACLRFIEFVDLFGRMVCCSFALLPCLVYLGFVDCELIGIDSPEYCLIGSLEFNGCERFTGKLSLKFAGEGVGL